jgi:oligopeptide transport system substrate-binding protein
MFEVGGLDFAGSPISVIPPDAIRSLKADKKLESAPAAGTQFIRVNVSSKPFANQKMRQAFNSAIDRKGICEHIMQGGHQPTVTFVPPYMLQVKTDTMELTDAKAQQLFKEALQEMRLTRESLPKISLTYVAKEREQKIAQALQQNWKTTLGVDVSLDPQEGKMFYEKIFKKDYQFAISSWLADFNDPINFLSIFQYKNNGTNNTEWENNMYASLLCASENEQRPEQRAHLLAQAEGLLLEEAPVFPIFHYNYNFVKNKRLQNANVSPLGFLELKEASVVEPAALATAK